MKLTTEEASRIARDLKIALADRRLSAANAARQSGIEPSRLSRILGGHFSTLNPNVVQICTFLGVSLPADRYPEGVTRIVRSALKVWNGSPDEVEEVVKLFDQIASLRRR
ncbi:helix-turn-helix transcriptional regulator [Thalassobaculum sp.]|uniref:helix-turn-helix domain-containing protein n=1 Tax=Thalassobaculum sp. TaxID=2022740 RepID=UPI0032ED51F6